MSMRARVTSRREQEYRRRQGVPATVEEPRWVEWDMSDYNNPPGEMYRYAKTHRYTVWAETSPGKWVHTYRGDDMDRAYESIEFWDERVNVKLIDASVLTLAKHQSASIDIRWADLFWRIANDPDYGKN